MKCTNCGAEIMDGESYCFRCNEPVYEMKSENNIKGIVVKIAKPIAKGLTDVVIDAVQVELEDIAARSGKKIQKSVHKKSKDLQKRIGIRKKTPIDLIKNARKK